ncbi:hypothetical protein ACH5RR_018409 [Cinchona calisaya]|uniref:Subtilisin-like protease fibronectin type-III domain-containing protein n=1 Tax=Cinchona calisaya TaxID=153742 RepID=A0ABD2ZQ03_9GENT
MAARVEKREKFKIEFPRTVTNVRTSNSKYKATTTKTSQCNIKVEPSILSYQGNERKTIFIVIVTGEKVENIISASLEWSDGIHLVPSPLVLYAINKTIT